MFEILLDMYLNNRISQVYLRKALKVNWITQEEYELMLEAKETMEAEKSETKE